MNCAAAVLKRKRIWDVTYTKGDIATGCIRFTVLQKKNKPLYHNFWTTGMQQLSQYCISTRFADALINAWTGLVI